MSGVRPFVVAAAVGLLPLAAGCAEDTPRCAATVSGLGDPVCADLAITADERRLGLGGRSTLGADDGLLIVFPATDQLCIQNETVAFAIDALWLAGDGTVVAAQTFDARATDTVCNGPARMVLELPADARPQAAPGVRLQIDPPPAPAVE